jgi:mannose-1-phosphate guanylyltransferase
VTQRSKRSSGAFWAVIPAGGAGTRLWPLSRATRPKFLLPLTGERSLLQQTVDRLAPLTTPDRTIVVCGPAHAAAIARQLPDVPDANLIVEPSPKGSGPAIGLAAMLIARQDPEAIMGSFAADHDVTDPAAFVSAVTAATTAAHAGWLCTIGLTPTRPDTGYGYIERSDEIAVPAGEANAFRALRFVEKPDLLRATEYLAAGNFLWNASMFVWKVRTLLEEIEVLMPELHEGLKRIGDAWDAPDRDRVVAEVWSSLADITIDHGIMERSDRVAVVPAEMGWSDVGDWHGLGELIERDSVGNSVLGDVVHLESRDCVVWSETKRVIALIGQENTVVVDTPDALMVINRDRAQDVKKMVEELKKLQRSEVI